MDLIIEGRIYVCLKLHTASYTVTYYKSYRCCKNHGSWWCWSYGYCSEAKQTTGITCAPGYRHNGNQVCNIPICSPPCENGGICVSPNKCSCRAGFQGDICNGIEACSHLYPCYPGRCHGNNQCKCSDGFLGPQCSRLQNEGFKPSIVKGNSSFAKYLYTQNSRLLFKFMTDATNSTETDTLWTNQAEFNEMRFDIDAQIDTKFVFGHIPPRPRYIRDQKFGIVEAKVDAEHYKLSRNLTEYLVNRQIFHCPQPLPTRPIGDNNILKCRLSNGTNVFQVDSGDRYFLTYTVTTGGFRELINTDNNNYYKTDVYQGISSQIHMEYRFDRDVPLHCSESGAGSPCGSGDNPFVLQEDITMEPLAPRWAGWIDKLSGVSRYSFEVWKMSYSRDYNVLREPEIRPTFNPVPEYILSINASNTYFPTYTPKGPGMYSAILEIVDAANNSRYVRRLAIYDNSSKITTQVDFPLFANSASSNTNYTWQTTPNSGSGSDTSIKVSWNRHFVNLEHEKESILKRVDKYSPRLSDNVTRIDYKKIDDKFDDNEGKRTLAAIDNRNSIVKFEYNIGGISTSIPMVGWVDIGLNQNLTKLLAGQVIRDGDARQVWIRSSDIVGHTLVDSIIINFDSSPPQVFSSDTTLEKNIHGQNYPFASRVTVAAKDDHSAIKKVKFVFRVNETNEIKTAREFMIHPNGLQTCTSSSCYCATLSGQTSCYDLETTLEINNCWLKVPMNKVDTDNHILDIVVFNSAMLSTTKSIELGTVTHFNGIQEYKSPSNVTIQKTFDTSLSISWVQPPTCYERAGILIRLFRPDNTTHDYIVDKDVTSFDLTGLQPTTNYWFMLYTKYGNETHFVTSASPYTLTFQTAETSVGFPPGGVAGLAVGFIVIIIIVAVVLIFLGRTGRLQPAKAKLIEVRRNFTVKRRNNTNSRGFNNRAYSTKFEDDIYYYGQMDIKSDNTVLSRKDIALETELTQGKFAIIYLAKYYGNHRDAQTVVAKVLRDDQNEANVMKMKAKINFYADKVGEHKNIMKFIGSVQDDTARGPFMVLEYCSNGVLKDFLQEKKSSVTMDLEERLFRMSFGVCLGMDYLASKQVVHRRLAARNILLDHLFEPKITGFGPDPEAGQEGDERLPLKWMAPECQKSTKEATELSDVFSYGVVVWEIFTLGETPYPGIQSRDVLTKQKQGYKMKKPEYCDDAFYKIMLKCWHYDPHKRSGFAQIKEELTNMFQEGPSDDYYYRTNDLE